MTWLQRYRLRESLHSAFWPAPLAAILIAVCFIRLARWIDANYHWTVLNFTAEGARSILAAFVASMLAFFVFIVSSLLVVVQLATAQLTPRIIAPVILHPAVRVALGIFIFSYTFTLGILGRVESTVPQLCVLIAILANLACVVAFIHFASRLGLALRPVVVLSTVAAKTRKVIEEVYPSPYEAGEEPPRIDPPSDPLSVVIHSGSSGVLLAFDAEGLVALAEKSGCVLELLPSVGEFVISDDALFRVHRGNAPDVALLRQAVAFGPERTLHQDPAFGFRTLADVACKALSPAINDPTTAKLALDQIHLLLRSVGGRKLGAGILTDGSRQVRLIHRSPSWEDFVRLGVSEARHYGASSLQIVRRMRAMLEHLIEILPSPRTAALQEELRLLALAVEQQFTDSRERQHAEVGDREGLGCAARSPAATLVPDR